jgi:hypothetical protein
MIYETIPTHRLVMKWPGPTPSPLSGTPLPTFNMQVEKIDTGRWTTVHSFPSFIALAKTVFPTVEVSRNDAADQSKMTFIAHRAAIRIAKTTRRGIARMLFRSVATKFNLTAPSFLEYTHISGDLVRDDQMVLCYDGGLKFLDGGVACVMNDDGSCEAYVIEERSNSPTASDYGVVFQIVS